MFTHKKCGFLWILGGIAAGLIFAALFSLAVGAIVMVLWNWLMPGIFGLCTINYWQGFGIVLLAKLVFGGFGKPFGPPPGRGYKFDGKHWGKFARYSRCRDSHFDDVYEDWWQNEGAERFESYMKQQKGEKEE